MIKYFDQSFLANTKIKHCLESHGIKFTDLLSARVRFDPGIPGIYNRKGTGTFPFKNGFVDHPGFSMPDYDANFEMTWSEITDQRCNQLRKQKFDKPWIVAWSGGTDSTNILTAIIKNLPPADFDNITVACNNHSVWENPCFFQNHVQNNFKLIDTNYLVSTQSIQDNNYILDGEPADQLFAGAISHKMFAQDSNLLSKNIIKNADYLIDYIAECNRSDFFAPPGKDFAKYYFEMMMQNISSLSIPIETFHDFFWWYYFNTSWVSVKFRCLSAGEWGKTGNAQNYLDRFIHWFDADNYQLWAMNNNIKGKKFGSTVGEYKLEAKKYIYELDGDQDRMKYKTKSYSNNHRWIDKDRWCCILDDFTLLNCRDHMDQITDLLPDHCN